MKRILWAGAFALIAGGQALAADLPPAPAPRAPATYVPVAVPVYNWSGIYIGVNGGYGFGTSNWSSPAATGFPASTTGNFGTNGWLGGGTVGANYQFWGGAVLGVEGDWDWTNLNGTSAAAPCIAVAPATGCQTSSNWLGTVRGRAGWALDRVLLYGTGGVAFAPIQTSITNSGGGTNSNTEVGWTAGAGVEFAFAPNWTAKAEYLYVDLNNGSCTSACGSPPAPAVAAKFTENVIRAGVNFKFNPW
jgi:outer membrane immunogenic protein